MLPFMAPMMIGQAGGGIEQPNPTITSFTFAERGSVVASNGERTVSTAADTQGGARAGVSAASIAATFTVGANGAAYVGVAIKGSNVQNPFGFAYGKDGDIYDNDAYIGVKAPTYGAGDTIKVATSSTSVFFYKNGTLVYTARRTDGGSNILYPAVLLVGGSATIA